MDAKLKNRLFKVIIWLAAEVTLNLLGMDTMADYSEFVFSQEPAIVHPTGTSISCQVG